MIFSLITIQQANNQYKTNPKNWENTISLALYYLTDGDLDKAKSLYQEVLNPKVSKYVILDAIDQLNDFLDAFPNNSQAKSMRELLENAVK